MRTAIGIGADRVRGARPHRVIASRKNRQKVVRPPPPPPPPDRSMLVLLLLYGDDGLMRSCHGACALTRRLWRPACAHPLPTGSVARHRHHRRRRRRRRRAARRKLSLADWVASAFSSLFPSHHPVSLSLPSSLPIMRHVMLASFRYE